jgi:hypothetical protein
MAVITYTAYSALIISYLAVNRPELPFHTFQGLLDDGTYDFGILRNSTTFALFQVRKFNLRTGLINFLCDAGKFEKIWSLHRQHEI